jgi:ketosteroid isomerase-like protein
MSQENVEVVRRYFEAVNRGDFAAAMAAYTDDVVLVIDERAVPVNAGVFAGRAAVGDWFGDWFRSFERGYQFRVAEMRTIGDRVLTSARHQGRGRASGVDLQWTLAYVFAFDAGKINRLELFADQGDALKAAGLEV